MDLTGSWTYIQDVARNRLAHNKTVHHVYDYGEGIEALGVAGEIIARRFLGLEEKVHEGFDGGSDFIYNGKTVDVKTTVFTPNIQYRFLQWPSWKAVKADIVFLTAVDPITKQGIPLGYATREEMKKSPVNSDRPTPCHEVPINKLHQPWVLIAEKLKL